MSTAIKHPRSRKRKSLTPLANEVSTFRRRYGIPQTLLARLLEVSLRTVSGAESTSTTPAQLRRNLTQMNRLCQALSEAMRAGFVGEWLDQPNEMLGGLKPVEAIERGKLDLVWRVAEGLRSGSQL